MNTFPKPAECTIDWCDKTCDWEPEPSAPGAQFYRMHRQQYGLYEVVQLESLSYGVSEFEEPLFEAVNGYDIAGCEMAGRAAADLFLLARSVSTCTPIPIHTHPKEGRK